MAGSCSLRSRSRSRSPKSKEQRKSNTSAANKKRGRPRIRPKKSPSQIKKRGRPKRGDLTFQRSSIQKDLQDKTNLTLPPSFKRLKRSSIGGRDSEDEENYDPNQIEETTRVLRNQEEVNADRAMHRRSDPMNPQKIIYTDQQLPIYNANRPPIQSRKFPTKQQYNDASFDVARLLVLTPYDSSQATFASQEIIRLSIQRKLLKKLIEISWSLIQGMQLPYNLFSYIYPKLGGTIAIDEEFISFKQIDDYGVQDEQCQQEIPNEPTVYYGSGYTGEIYVQYKDGSYYPVDDETANAIMVQEEEPDVCLDPLNEEDYENYIFQSIEGFLI